ncbi:chaplin [Streptomyces sp. Da 82-17]|uniref:chaplin n=1 Tax=Streptomyces sp. Da 82-17 TaxID=3377116 RepID=UPI0038D4AAF1
MKIVKLGAMAVASTALLLGGAGVAAASDPGPGSGASASGVSSNSPGVLSGNTVQVPIHVPVNVCGNTINVIGLLNPAAGNVCINK